MSVLYEHQTSNSCDGPHDLTERAPLEVVTTEHTPVGWTETRNTGWVQSCVRCGTVIEFRMGEDYPPPARVHDGRSL